MKTNLFFAGIVSLENISKKIKEQTSPKQYTHSTIPQVERNFRTVGLPQLLAHDPPPIARLESRPQVYRGQAGKACFRLTVSMAELT